MPMRFGTIGTNFISREFRKAGEKLEGFSLAVVYSRTVETARAHEAISNGNNNIKNFLIYIFAT